MEEKPTTWKERVATECQTSDPTAAIWPVIRLVAISVFGLIAFHTYYSNGFDPQKDGATLATFLIASGAIDIAKRFIATGDVVAGAKPSDKQES